MNDRLSFVIFVLLISIIGYIGFTAIKQNLQQSNQEQNIRVENAERQTVE